MRVTKSVSEKNTKQEILEAYQDIISKVEEKPISESTQNQIQKANASAVSSLKAQLNELTEQQSRVIEDIQSQMEAVMAVLGSLRQKSEQQKKSLEEEEKERMRERTRQEEEYTYEFAKTKKRQEEELKEARQKAEADFAAKREELKAQETELVDLRNQARTFEPRLAKGINDAVEEVTKEMMLQFEHEKALAEAQAKATQTLLEQKVMLLENTIEGQKVEIGRLNQTAVAAVDQMTRIAERAVTKGDMHAAPQSPHD